MTTVWLDDITAHYSETVKRWRNTFVASSDLASELGYDRTFRRMWELYLAYVEAGFRERRINDVQMVFAKPQWRSVLGLAAETVPGDLVEQERRSAAR